MRKYNDKRINKERAKNRLSEVYTEFNKIENTVDYKQLYYEVRNYFKTVDSGKSTVNKMNELEAKALEKKLLENVHESLKNAINAIELPKTYSAKRTHTSIRKMLNDESVKPIFDDKKFDMMLQHAGKTNRYIIPKMEDYKLDEKETHKKRREDERAAEKARKQEEHRQKAEQKRLAEIARLERIQKEADEHSRERSKILENLKAPTRPEGQRQEEQPGEDVGETLSEEQSAEDVETISSEEQSNENGEGEALPTTSEALDKTPTQILLPPGLSNKPKKK